ncbi:hypothetical protein P7C73_g3827, partial [Tremellales sp. Uapishka_1]
MGSDEKPAGGHDDTPLHPSKETTYTVKITFHRASNLPVSDYGARSADPFVIAEINSDVPTRHSEDPPIRFRTHTVQRSLSPEWNSEWIVAGVPSSGFTLKARVYDEDPEDHDDKLGKVEMTTGRISGGWKGIQEENQKIHKTGANFRAYALRSCMTMMNRSRKLHAQLVVSIQILEKTKEEMGKIYTMNNFWFVHYSPLIGKIAGTKNSDEKGVEKSSFQANEIQLTGPVPNELYHRFVDFKPFVHGMFEGKGVRGRVLNNVLHHQHEKIYNFDKTTKFGVLRDGPGRDMSLQFLDMVHYDQGGRIFTYVITLDGLWRFTETGKQFGIDLLSKHTMHSDVNIYIAWSGEFLVRRLAHSDKAAEDPEQSTHPANPLPGGAPDSTSPKDPKQYELIIDNDSGTYRPKEELLPVLQKFLEKNLPGIQVVVKNCTDKGLEKIKADQKKTRKTEGEGMVYGQGSDSGSISSSDEEDLDDRAQGGKQKKGGKGAAVEALEDPVKAIHGLIPGAAAKEQREERETHDDQA